MARCRGVMIGDQRVFGSDTEDRTVGNDAIVVATSAANQCQYCRLVGRQA
jgi:hypothetical protein